MPTPPTQIHPEDLKRLTWRDRAKILSVYLSKEVAARFERELERQRERNPRVSMNSLARHAIRAMLDQVESGRGELDADQIVLDARPDRPGFTKIGGR